MKKLFIILSLLAVLTSCTQEKIVYSCIKPLPSGVDLANLTDATVPASFEACAFFWPDNTLSFDAWSEDLYDAVEVSKMQKGDTLIFQGDSIVVDSIMVEDAILTINGGLENGGAWLQAYEGGTYRGMQFDDHSTYTRLGNTAIPLAVDFKFIDCGEQYTDPYDTVVEGQRVYIEALEGGKKSFSELNTTVTVSHGVITEITRRWIP